MAALIPRLLVLPHGGGEGAQGDGAMGGGRHEGRTHIPESGDGTGDDLKMGRATGGDLKMGRATG
eukprot:6825065-Prymnesium_polylepis.1